MKVEEIETESGLEFLLTRDDKSKVRVGWLSDSKWVFIASFGPRGGSREMIVVPLSTLERFLSAITYRSWGKEE